MSLVLANNMHQLPDYTQVPPSIGNETTKKIWQKALFLWYEKEFVDTLTKEKKRNLLAQNQTGTIL